MRSEPRTAAVVVLCLLAACQRADVAPAAGTADSPRGVTIDAAAPGSVESPGAVARGAAQTSAALVALDGEGLRLVVRTTGATRLIAFGTAETAAMTAVTAALGAPASRGTNADCGAGPVDFVAFDGGLSLVLQREKLVGWSARRSATAVRMTTMSGVGVGTTRASLDSSYAATVSQTSLGTEFAAGGLYGVLDGPSPTAVITDMWAGTSCVAR